MSKPKIDWSKNPHSKLDQDASWLKAENSTLRAEVERLNEQRREDNFLIQERNARIAELEAALTEIANYAQERSQGPTVFDALWDVRSKALMALCGEVE